MKCWNVKRGWEEANSRHEDLSRGLVSHKGTPTATLLKHSQRVLFPGNQLSSVDTTKVTLILIFTKELPIKDGGPHVPRTKLSTPLHTKPDGRWRVGKPPRLQGWPAHRDTKVIHSRTSSQGITPRPHTLSRANPSTNTHKACAKPKNLINLHLGA